MATENGNFQVLEASKEPQRLIKKSIFGPPQKKTQREVFFSRLGSGLSIEILISSQLNA
jgi:hypothetical protein